MSSTTTQGQAAPGLHGWSSRRCGLRWVGAVIFFCLLLDVSNTFLPGVFVFEADGSDAAVHRVSTRVGIAAPPGRAVLPASAVLDSRSTFARPAWRPGSYVTILTFCLGHRDRGGADSAPPSEDPTSSLITLV